MALTDTSPPETAVEPAGDDQASGPATSPVAQFFGTGDHRAIGRMFIIGSLAFLAIDLVVAAVANFDITSGGDLLGDDIGARLWANLPLSLILGGALPLMLGLAVHIVPLQVGASTVAFPRAAALSWWSWLIGAVMFGICWSLDGAYGGTRGDLPQLGNLAVGLMALALSVGAVCVAVTVLGLRVAGLTVARVPFFSFGFLVTATVWVATLPALVADVALGHIQDPTPADLLDTVYPSIEWFLRQPSVYIVVVPILGLILDAVSASVGARATARGVGQFMIGAAGLLAFGAWAQSEMSSENVVAVVFAIAAGLPVIGVLGGALDMARRGAPNPSADFIGSMGAGFLLLMATLTGALVGIDTIGDGQLVGFRTGSFGSDPGGPGLTTAVAMFVIAAAVVAGITGVALWRRSLGAGSMGMAAVAAGLATLGGLVMGTGPLVVGLADPDASGVEVLSGVSGAGSLLVAFGAILAVFDLILGLTRSDEQTDGPEGGTLEFSADPSDVSSLVISDAYPLYDRNEDGDA